MSQFAGVLLSFHEFSGNIPHVYLRNFYRHGKIKKLFFVEFFAIRLYLPKIGGYVNPYQKLGISTAGLTFCLLGSDFAPAYAVAIAPISSELRLEASSNAGDGLVTDTNSQSQGSTVNPLSASTSALATFGDANVLSTAAGVATWVDSSQGEVNLFDIGWNSAGVTFGSALPSFGLDWTYTFTTSETGLFNLNYNITGFGSDASGPSTFGLNGFSFYWSGLEGGMFLNLNTSGTLTQEIAAGNTYTVTIKNQANIGGRLGTRNARMNGVFDWSINTDSINTDATVPEPATVGGTLIIGGIGWLVKRKKAASQRSN
jgi:hypothetical protein